MSDVQAAYQRALLRLLHDGAGPEEILARLLADPALVELSDYIESIDPHALVVARELVAHWSGRDQPL